MTVATTQEAMDFFLNNSSGSVTCEKDGEQKECTTFPEAKKFFGEEE